MAELIQSYGKLRAGFFLSCTFIVSILVSILGVYLIQKEPIFVNKTTGKATNVNCASSNVCTTDVLLTSPVSDVTTTKLTFNIPIKNDEIVTVFYSNDIPPKFSSSTDEVPKFFGPSLIVCASCAMCISIMIYYFVSSSPAFATIYGGFGAISNAQRVF
jgi:hypothetical protein